MHLSVVLLQKVTCCWNWSVPVHQSFYLICTIICKKNKHFQIFQKRNQLITGKQTVARVKLKLFGCLHAGYQKKNAFLQAN